MQVWPPSWAAAKTSASTDRARVDALVGLDVAQRGYAVAIDRGALEIEPLARRLHELQQAVLDAFALAGEEVERLGDQPVVVLG
jgi:hypothetical protein